MKLFTWTFGEVSKTVELYTSSYGKKTQRKNKNMQITNHSEVNPGVCPKEFKPSWLLPPK